MANRRKDNKRRVLKEGETQRSDGTYDYRWRTSDGKRHSVYAKTLEELRQKEETIRRNKSDGIRTDVQNVRLCDIYDLWVGLKKGLKGNTFQGYQFLYQRFIYPKLGNMKIAKIKRSDIRRFYNTLADENKLSIWTIDNIHTVLHQILNLAVEDEYLRSNPSDNALRELKQSHNLGTERRRALTAEEEHLFMSFLSKNGPYHHWKPIFEVMLGSGMRVGEATGLRWQDIDLEKRTISVNHTLVYYDHGETGCGFNVNTPKTKAGCRVIPMTEDVRKAFLEEKAIQDELGITCQLTVDGFTDFIFLTDSGRPREYIGLNKALRRIISACNKEILENAGDNENVVLLPHFSCHILRHSFTTRLCEAGVHIKVIQDVLGHADIGITMNIYADATKDLKKKEFTAFESFITQQKEKFDKSE